MVMIFGPDYLFHSAPRYSTPTETATAVAANSAPPDVQPILHAITEVHYNQVFGTKSHYVNAQTTRKYHETKLNKKMAR